MPDTVHIQGWDLSLNHAGIVELDQDYNLIGYWFIVSTIKMHKAYPDCTFILRPPKDLSTEMREVHRLQWWHRFISSHLFRTYPDFVVVEGYAFAQGKQSSNRIVQTGELGGIAKLVFSKTAGLRVHDPKTVKLYAAESGNADKDQMISSVKNRWDICFSDLVPKANKEAVEDLTDAYALAHLGVTEYLLRQGRLTLSDLDESTIRVFNRVTKSYPESILSRDWIRTGNGSAPKTQPQV